jgi:hypothetical protein
MSIVGYGTYFFEVNSSPVIVEFEDDKPPTFTVQMAKNRFNEFYWVNGSN